MGVPVELHVREGRDHAWPGWQADSKLIASWFDARLGVTR